MALPTFPLHGNSMLRASSIAGRYCDNVNRRSFLRIGGLFAGGLFSGGLLPAGVALPDLFAAEAVTGKTSHKSVISIYLSGGMPHQDTFDLKPDAPDGIRGEFRPIGTVVPGIEISELLPGIAGCMDRCAIVRSITGLRDEHSSFQTLTGFPMDESLRDGKPHLGCAIAQTLGNTSPVVPAFVDLFPRMQHRPYNSPGPGFLGPSFAGIRADGEDLASMSLRHIDIGRFEHRRQLLAEMDLLKRHTSAPRLNSVNNSYDRAFDVLTSSAIVNALDVSKEDPAVAARYSLGNEKHHGDGAPLWNRHLLMARRLVEAGVRCVSVAYGFWDTHGNNFQHLKLNLPTFDQGISALVTDLHERGLDRDTLVVVWGEFGRTPKINANAGRDHWPRVNSVLLAGGGLKMGQVIGSTDKFADSVKDRAVNYLDVIATIYRTLGIDEHAMLTDIANRPLPILPGSAQVIRELV